MIDPGDLDPAEGDQILEDLMDALHGRLEE